MDQIPEKSLIVSCQALPDEPLYGSKIMARMAQAAQLGGAAAIRANSPGDIKAIRETVELPIIGLWKQELSNYEVYITPRYQDIKEVLAAGADYVAVDATNRNRPEELNELFAKIRTEFPNKGIVADISTVQEAVQITELKPDFIATTLSGYTAASSSRPAPDIPLVEEVARLIEIPILAEGNYKTGAQAAQALQAGAWAVVMGGAITRPRSITSYIKEEMEQKLRGEVSHEQFFK